MRPRPLGGDKRSGRIEAYAPVILAAVEQTPDITLVELRNLLAAQGLAVAVSTLWRFFARRKITLKKKSGHAAEQDRPDVLDRRHAWFEGQLDLDPERLIFIDETGASTKMARPPRPRASGPAPARRPSARTLEDHHLRWCAAAQRHDRAHGAGRTHDRGLVPQLR